MFEKLEALYERYLELGEEIAQSEVIASFARYQACLKERASLEETVTAYEAYKSLRQQIADTQELAKDAEMANEAKAELELLLPQEQQLLQTLQLLLVPADPMDHRDTLMELRAGVGGEEAALFCGDLLRMYQKYCDRCGLKAVLLSVSDTDLGGISEALLSVSGEEAYARMKFESGVHCVKRVPVTESGGRIHTSTATVAVFPEAEDSEVLLSPADVRIDVFHASGKGGQGVNTSDSAVRVTHLPTGIVVSCQDERSQLENKARALKVLRSRLLDRQHQAQQAKEAADRRSQIGSGDRSERVRTYYFNHDYVVDHRINLTVNRTVNTMNGDLEPFICALRLAEKTEKLTNLHETKS